MTRLPFGIVGPTRGQSVLLFSDRPMAELGGRRIAVTGETSTSVRLLRILLAFRHEVPAARPGRPRRAGRRRAHHRRRGAPPPPGARGPGAYCYDLGEEWTRWTGHPMVFAAWAVRLDIAGRGARRPGVDARARARDRPREPPRHRGAAARPRALRGARSSPTSRASATGSGPTTRRRWASIAGFWRCSRADAHDGPAMLETVRAKVDGGIRLSRDEGRWLLTEAPLLEVGQLANAAAPPPPSRAAR